MITEADVEFMQQAMHLAAAVDAKKTNPNPRVGCVIVEAGQVVAFGAHQNDGGPHAEIEAFEALGDRPITGATLYVTLEPCSTAGRTGACCDRIINSGLIQRVVIGAIDPNPVHQGRGVSILKTAGILVDTGCLAEEARQMNLEFFQRMGA